MADVAAGAPASEIGVGIIGLGNVGFGAYEILCNNSDTVTRQTGLPVRVTYVADIRADEARKRLDSSVKVTKDAMELISSPDVHIVCELIGGVKPAGDFIRAALKAGKSVVTSNKELIAKHGAELLKLAEDNGADFYFEGSVGGGIPIISPLRSGLAGNRIRRIIGIVNGTTNYILTEMDENNEPLDTVLVRAQQKGYAEADPSNDIQGYDARYKITILAGLGFQAKLETEKIHCEGITAISADDVAYARQMGYRIKLLAVARALDGGIDARVHPALVPESHPLASVNGVNNAIYVTGDAVGDVMFYGPGAGGPAAGSAVVGDIIEVARNICRSATGRIKAPEFRKVPLLPAGEASARFYIRLKADDHPGVLASITRIFSEQGVSISSVLQKEASDGTAEIIFMTHEVPEKKFGDALSDIAALADVHDISSCIRVEE